MDDQQVIKVLQEHTRVLREHFDSVQVFVTRHNGHTEITESYQHGSGSWYERVGNVRMWTLRMEEDARLRAQRAFEADEDESGGEESQP